MKAILPFLLMAGCLVAGCGKQDTSKPGNSSSGNPVTAPVDYLGAVGKAKQAADKSAASSSLNQAIKLFHAQEGRFPKTLNELIQPDYLNAIPPPPTGMKYDYDPTNGVVKVVPK